MMRRQGYGGLGRGGRKKNKSKKNQSKKNQRDDKEINLTPSERKIIRELRGTQPTTNSNKNSRTSADNSQTKPRALEKRKPVPQPNGSKRGIMPEQPCAMMFCGLSKSGKSTLLKDTLTDKNLLGGGGSSGSKPYFHTIVMMSPTADADTTITEALKLPPENIITNFTEDDLEEIIEAQRSKIKKEGYNKVAKTNRMLIILDDCISHQRFLRSQTIIDLTATVRHLLISVVFLMQSYRMIARACRINLRGIAFFQSNRNETDVLCEEECPDSLKTREFRNLIHEATKEKYSYLFINKDRPYNERYLCKYDTILEIV